MSKSRIGRICPAGYVASSVQHRNLKPSQLALIAAGFLEYERGLAKGRQSALNGKRQLPENFPEAKPGEARDKAGERMHVSGRMVDEAAKVLAKRSMYFTKVTA